MQCSICASMWFIMLLHRSSGVHTLKRTRRVINHRAETVWQEMAQGSWLSPAVVPGSAWCGSTSAAAPVSICHTHTHTRWRRRTWGGLIRHLGHSLTALLGVLQGAARRLTKPAVMLDEGGRGGGVRSFWWHQLRLTPAQCPLCHTEIVINTAFSLLAPLRWGPDVFSSFISIYLNLMEEEYHVWGWADFGLVKWEQGSTPCFISLLLFSPVLCFTSADF